MENTSPVELPEVPPSGGQERLSWFIQRTMVKLYATLAEFVRVSKLVDPKGEGITDQTYRSWTIGGQVPTRGDKRRVLLDTLRWSREPDSIQLIIDGGDPIVNNNARTVVDLTERVGRIEVAFDELRRTLEELRRSPKKDLGGSAPAP